MSHHRETVTAAGAPEAAGPYSHAVKSGGLIFLSGQTPIDPDAGSSSRATSARRRSAASTTSRSSRAAAGASLDDAVRCGIYVTDMATFKDVNAAYAGYFGDAPPARSTIGVAALPLGADVEIDAILAVPD